MPKHDLNTATRSLSRKHDCRIYGTTIKILSNKVYSPKLKQVIENPEKKHDLGNGSWGRISFLQQVFGFHTEYTDTFQRQ